jgi:hypothetical protein
MIPGRFKQLFESDRVAGVAGGFARADEGDLCSGYRILG